MDQPVIDLADGRLWADIGGEPPTAMPPAEPFSPADHIVAGEHRLGGGHAPLRHRVHNRISRADWPVTRAVVHSVQCPTSIRWMRRGSEYHGGALRASSRRRPPGPGSRHLHADHPKLGMVAVHQARSGSCRETHAARTAQADQSVLHAAAGCKPLLVAPIVGRWYLEISPARLAFV